MFCVFVYVISLTCVTVLADQNRSCSYTTLKDPQGETRYYTGKLIARKQVYNNLFKFHILIYKRH